MKTFTFVIACAFVGATVAAAAPVSPVEVPIRQFVDSFNKGDTNGAEAATVSSGMTVTDEVPPFQWQGANAFKAWLDDLGTFDTAHGRTDGNVTVGKTIRQEISGDNAYVIISGVYSFKEHGKAMHAAAQLTFTLRQEAAGWRISGMTYTAPKPTASR